MENRRTFEAIQEARCSADPARLGLVRCERLEIRPAASCQRSWQTNKKFSLDIRCRVRAQLVETRPRGSIEVDLMGVGLGDLPFKISSSISP